LHVHARDQFLKLLLHYGFDPDSPLCAAELSAWDEVPTYAATRDRSLLGSMNRFKDDAWDHFAYVDRSLPEAAARQWEGLFRHPGLARTRKRYDYSAWHRPLDLVAARLVPAGLVMPGTGQASRRGASAPSSACGGRSDYAVPACRAPFATGRGSCGRPAQRRGAPGHSGVYHPHPSFHPN